MKWINIFLISIIAVSCIKIEKPSETVTITIKDKYTGLMLPDFSYKITTHGLGGMQDEVQRTGTFDGFTSFKYTPVKYRSNELELHSDSVKGYFPKYGYNAYITEDNRDFVFEYISFKHLKIVVTNTSCLNANDKISIAVHKESQYYTDTDYASITGCQDNHLLYNEPLSEGNYEISWNITRDSGTTFGSEIVELTELEDKIYYINY